jgi:hypothetical protein
MTPQSSNASTKLRDRERTHEKGQSDRRDSPGAILLQERLKEKKAAMFSEHRRSIDVEALGDERGPYGTPRNASTSRSGRDRDVTQGSNGERLAGKKGMGVKEMEEVIAHSRFS